MYIKHSANGLEFRALEVGDPSADPILLLHGFPEDATCWDSVAQRLGSAGYRTVAPDLRGYSVGTRTGRQRDYAVTNLVEDVIGLVHSVGGRPHVVGHDWGGSLLWTLRKKSPELLASATLISSPHPSALAWAMTHSVEQPLKSWYVGAISLPALPEIFLRKSLAPFLRRSGLPAERADYYQARANEPGAATAMLAWYRQMLVDRMTSSADETPASRDAHDVRTAYLWGTEDRFLGKTAAERTANRQDLDSAKFVRGGHWLPETNPDDVAEAILANVAGATAR